MKTILLSHFYYEVYFMRGDNVENSADSRVFGMVYRRQILGLAKVVVFNFQLSRDKMKTIN